MLILLANVIIFMVIIDNYHFDDNSSQTHCYFSHHHLSYHNYQYLQMYLGMIIKCISFKSDFYHWNGYHCH
jgi:hypothetical protein